MKLYVKVDELCTDGKIMLDDKDITRHVRGFNVEGSVGQKVLVTLYLQLVEVELDLGNVEVEKEIK